MPKHDHPPSFPFYVDDFIGDGAVDAMTNEEVGIYVRLLCKAWKETPVGTIPSDDTTLSRWAKATPAVWKKAKAGVLRAFVAGDDGRLHQKRMKAVWAKTLERREACSEGGKKGMAKRYGSYNQVSGGLLTQSNFPSSSSSPLSKDDKDDSGAEFSGEESERLLQRARRLQTVSKINVGRSESDRSLLAKVAVLWDSGDLSDDDIEQVLESFRAGKHIQKRGGWFHRCLANRCEAKGLDFNGLLARTVVPVCLAMPQPQGATA